MVVSVTVVCSKIDFWGILVIQTFNNFSLIMLGWHEYQLYAVLIILFLLFSHSKDQLMRVKKT